MKIAYGSSRIDWMTERGRVDFVKLLTDRRGPPVRRSGSRLVWRCPFCDDTSGHFSVKDGDTSGKCFRCGKSADAPSLVMRLDGLTFPQAVNVLTGGALPTRTDNQPRLTNTAKPIVTGPALATRMPHDDALALVEDAKARLWSSEGADALAYLTGSERCLTLETIHRAQLGWTSRAVGVAWTPPGIVIPWFVGDRLATVKVRPDPSFRESRPTERRPPKYLEAYRDPSIRVCYPGPMTIRIGRPLIVTEGEFDAMLLGQELGDMASVITLGSASTRPDRPILDLARKAPAWYVATDADDAGDKAAEAWPGRARRVRPPVAFKDWTEAAQAGVELRRWWGALLKGNEAPPLFSWEELSKWRWGPAAGDSTRSIDAYPPEERPS